MASDCCYIRRVKLSSISLIQLSGTSFRRKPSEISRLTPSSMPRVGLDDAKPTLSIDCSTSGDMLQDNPPYPCSGSRLGSCLERDWLLDTFKHTITTVRGIEIKPKSSMRCEPCPIPSKYVLRELKGSWQSCERNLLAISQIGFLKSSARSKTTQISTRS